MAGTHLVRELRLHFVLRDPLFVSLINFRLHHVIVDIVRSLHVIHGGVNSTIHAIHLAVIVSTGPLRILHECRNMVACQVLRILLVVEFPLVLLQLPVYLSVTLPRYFHPEHASIDFYVIFGIATATDFVDNFIFSDSSHGLTGQSGILDSSFQGAPEVELICVSSSTQRTWRTALHEERI